MVAFLETILVFAGIGQLLDLILIGPKQREKIGAYLERSKPNGSLLSRYLGMLSLSRDVVFGRFFSESFASIKFFRSTAILSVLSFVFVVFLQSAFFGKLPVSLTSPGQIATISVFLIFNILIDYFSIAQTKAFIDASAAAKSWFRSLLFLISDVLVTMNIFILAFSMFLMFFSFIYLTPNVVSNRTLILSNEAVAEADTPKEGSSALFGTPQTAIVLGSANGSLVAEFLGYGGNTKLSPEIFEQVVRVVLGQSLTGLSIMPADTSSALKDLEIAVSRDALQKTITELYLGKGSSEAFQLSISSSFYPQSISDLNYAYTSVFSFVDLLEDGFPQNVVSDNGWTPLSEIIKGIFRNQTLSGPAYQVLCFDGATLLGSYFSFEDPITFQDECKQRLVLRSTDRLSLINDFALSERESENLYIPYIPMFVTSILPTSFFYFSILALSISTFLFHLIVSQLKVRKDLLLRVPLTLPLALVGVIYAL